MARIAFSWPNLVARSSVVVSASAEPGDLVAANVKTPIVGVPWRLVGTQGWIRVDHGEDVTAQLFGLAMPVDVALPGGTVRHRFDADGGTPGTGAVHDTGPVALDLAEGYGLHGIETGAPITYRYWHAAFDLVGVDFMDLGLMWSGPLFRPALGLAPGWGDAWEDLSVVTPAERSGAEYVDERPRQRVVTLTLAHIRGSDREGVRELQRWAGRARQVWASLPRLGQEPPGRSHVLGRLAETTPLVQPRFNLFAKRFTIRGSL